MDTRDPYLPIKSARLYEQMADQIKERIFNGELQEGDQLPNETELAERFGVSRTVVREAMKRLEQEGFVEVQRGRGTFVTKPSARIWSKQPSRSWAGWIFWSITPVVSSSVNPLKS